MALRKDLEDLDTNGQLGDWCFHNNDKYIFIIYAYPSHVEGFVKDHVGLPIHRAGEPEGDRPSWLWDGNREAPTISPSIEVIDRWHGYLRAGKLENA